MFILKQLIAIGNKLEKNHPVGTCIPRPRLLEVVLVLHPYVKTRQQRLTRNVHISLRHDARPVNAFPHYATSQN